MIPKLRDMRAAPFALMDELAQNGCGAMIPKLGDVRAAPFALSP
jgi:hypothetical protein